MKKIMFILFSIMCYFNYLNASKQIDIIYTASLPDITLTKNGTFSQLSTVLQKTRSKNKNTIFLFGGNSLGPSPMSTLDKGSHIIDILNSLEPDVMSLDKKEFSYYEDEISLRSYEAAFPIIASNISDKLTNENIDGIKDYQIIEKDGIKIGVLSVLNEELIDEYNIRRVNVHDIFASVKNKAKKLRQNGVDFVILLSSDYYSVIDILLKEKIVDFSISKNIHFDLVENNTRPKTKNNILITKKADFLKLVLIFENNKLKTFNTKVESLSEYVKEPIIERRIQDYSNRLNLLLDETIGVFKSQIDSRRIVVRTKESLIGNLIADAAKQYTDADMALINGGTIRGDILYKKGHRVTRKDISKELPYRNYLVLLEVNAKQLVDSLENGFSLVENLKGRFPQVSGMKVKYDLTKKPGNRVVAVTVNNKPLDFNRTYKIAVTDYLAKGGDGYSAFRKAKELDFYNPSNRLISNIVTEYVKNKKIIDLKIEGRLKEVNE